MYHSQITTITAIALFYRSINYFMQSNGSLQTTSEYAGSLEAISNEISELSKNAEQNNGKQLLKKIDIEFENVTFKFDNEKNQF